MREGNPLGEPELEDPIVTGAPLLEIKRASHTLGGVKIEADVANAHSVYVCQWEGAGKAILYNPTKWQQEHHGHPD